MKIETWDPETRRVVFETWERLPLSVRIALDDVVFTTNRYARKALATAGHRDIDIQRLPVGTDVAVAVVAHELGHVAGDHLGRIARGEMTDAEAEAEADRYARAWGFGRELDQRRLALGR